MILVSAGVGFYIYDRHRVAKAMEAVAQKAVEAQRANEAKAAAKDKVWAALEPHFPGGLTGPGTIRAAVGQASPDEVQSINTRGGDLQEKRLLYRDADLYIVVMPGGEGWRMTRAVDGTSGKEISLAAAASRIVGSVTR